MLIFFSSMYLKDYYYKGFYTFLVLFFKRPRGITGAGVVLDSDSNPAPYSATTEDHTGMTLY